MEEKRRKSFYSAALLTFPAACAGGSGQAAQPQRVCDGAGGTVWLQMFPSPSLPLPCLLHLFLCFLPVPCQEGPPRGSPAPRWPRPVGTAAPTVSGFQHVHSWCRCRAVGSAGAMSRFLSWMAHNPLDSKPEGCWALRYPRNAREFIGELHKVLQASQGFVIHWVNFLNPSQTRVLGNWMDAIYSAMSFNTCAAVLSHAQAVWHLQTTTLVTQDASPSAFLYHGVAEVKEMSWALLTMWKCVLNQHLVTMSWPHFNMDNFSGPRLGSYRLFFFLTPYLGKSQDTVFTFPWA